MEEGSAKPTTAMTMPGTIKPVASSQGNEPVSEMNPPGSSPMVLPS